MEGVQTNSKNEVTFKGTINSQVFCCLWWRWRLYLGGGDGTSLGLQLRLLFVFIRKLDNSVDLIVLPAHQSSFNH